MGTGKGLQWYLRWYVGISHLDVHRLFQHNLRYRLTYCDIARESTKWQQILKYLSLLDKSGHLKNWIFSWSLITYKLLPFCGSVPCLKIGEYSVLGFCVALTYYRSCAVYFAHTGIAVTWGFQVFQVGLSLSNKNWVCLLHAESRRV
jgi:hypothetical protein